MAICGRNLRAGVGLCTGGLLCVVLGIGIGWGTSNHVIPSACLDIQNQTIFAQNEMIGKLQDQNRDLQSKIDKVQGDLHVCRTESGKHGEQMSAQNEMIEKLQDQNRDLQSKTDKMQGDLQRCRTESGRHGELVQELKRDLEYCGNQNSNLREKCESQTCKSQDYKIWWLILPFVLGCFLSCCLGCWSK